MHHFMCDRTILSRFSLGINPYDRDFLDGKSPLPRHSVSVRTAPPGHAANSQTDYSHTKLRYRHEAVIDVSDRSGYQFQCFFTEL